MKSFCIKTNNNAILEYLLDKLDYLELEEVKYSKNKFKIYSNIIVHYIGEKISFFDEKLSSIITDTILKFYKEKMIKKIIHLVLILFIIGIFSAAYITNGTNSNSSNNNVMGSIEGKRVYT